MSHSFRIALDADALLARAREVTGIGLVDERAHEPLTVLLRSLNEEANLHERGARAKQERILVMLCNRLRMQRDLLRHPQIREQPIHGPVVVHGMARSGTTKLQKLLAASGDFNWLPYWQCYNPSLWTGERDESPRPRIEQADAYCRWFETASPHARAGHHFDTLQPEEDTVLTETCLVAPQFVGYGFVPGYLGWLATQPPSILFEFLREALQYLQWQGLADASRPWVIKAPTYYGLELELLKVFPQARIVMAHRSPLATVPSSCRLVDCFTVPFSDVMLPHAVLLEGFRTMIGAHLDVRQSHPRLPLLDLRFEEISAAGDRGVLDRIYEHAGVPLSDGARTRVRAWCAENPQHKHGVFEYSLQQFDLTEAQVRGAMQRYFDFYEQRFGATI